MSKEAKNIKLEVNEVKNQAQKAWEVRIPKRATIGSIQLDGKNYQVTTTKSAHQITTKSLENAINELISYYNLHENH